MRRTSLCLALVTASIALLASSAAFAQEKAGSDHDKVVGRLGIGYLGLREVGIGSPASAVPTPVIGARYWLSSAMAIEIGAGFGWVGGSTDTVNGGNTTSTDKPSATAFALHGGVPLSLASGQHTSFQIIPELNLGMGTGTVKVANQPDTTNTGMLLTAGARAGLEVHFGFIGVPELSLVGSVGAYFSRVASKTSREVNGTTTSQSDTSTGFGTTVGPNPWAIFTNNISAIYYF